MKDSRVDWGELLRRQEAASAALLQQPAPSPDQELEILKARAAQLAVPPQDRSGGHECVDCLEFRLSGESYAIDMSYVSETLPLAEFTQLFCTPPFVLGVINVRGKIFSIVDLRRFFELPVVGLSDLNLVILVADGTMEFGILADAIVGMRSLTLEELQPPPATFTGIREEFLTGITTDRLALLDAAKILSDRRVIVRDDVI